ncbi:hypothetical protein SK128_003644, partial [Halocaridina rubra]
MKDAIRENSYYDHFTLKRGNASTLLLEATHILEGEMYVGGQEHFYMETNAHLAVPKGEDGEVELFSSSQNPTLTQKLAAKALGIPENRIVVRVKRLGGGFGGKETRSTILALPVCVAALALNQPVRIMLDRHEDMMMTGGRHPFYCKWKVGFSEEGVLTALKADLYSNAGISQDVSLQVMQRALFALDNSYKCDNIYIEGHVCKTNLPSNTAFRGFGNPQSMLVVEDIMSRIAAYLQLDPCVVRRRNLYKTGDKSFLGQIIDRCTLPQCWHEVIEQSEYHARKLAVLRFNKENKYIKRGLSVVPLKFGIGFVALHRNQAGALVHVYTDGSVLLSHGGVEMGQGLHTKMIQVAARVLKISAEKIFIGETSSDKVPNTSPTAASVSSDLNGMAVKNACEAIYHRLEPFIAKNPKGSWEDWVKAAYFDRISLSATGFYKTPDITSFDFVKQTGNHFNYFTFGAAVSEVEIDCLTGDHSILRTDIVMDVGESLNPAIDIGQIEGAFMQGVGLCTLEELRYSPDGELLTRGPGAYKIP